MQLNRIDYSNKKHAESIKKENFRIYKRLVEIYTGFDRRKKSDSTESNRHNKTLSETIKRANSFRRATECERIQTENLRICKRLLEIEYKKK
jgi:hypothetical protein